MSFNFGYENYACPLKMLPFKYPAEYSEQIELCLLVAKGNTGKRPVSTLPSHLAL